MSNINTEETDYSVYLQTILEGKEKEEEVSKLPISGNFYFSRKKPTLAA